MGGQRQVMERTLVIFMEGKSDFSWNHTEAYQHKIKKQALLPLTDGLSWHSYIIPYLPACLRLPPLFIHLPLSRLPPIFLFCPTLSAPPAFVVNYTTATTATT